MDQGDRGGVLSHPFEGGQAESTDQFTFTQDIERRKVYSRSTIESGRGNGRPDSRNSLTDLFENTYDILK